MGNIRKTLVGLCVVGLSLGALAQNADEHKDHHPAGPSSPAASTQKGSAKSMSTGNMAAMDRHMKAMQATWKQPLKQLWQRKTAGQICLGNTVRRFS